MTKAVDGGRSQDAVGKSLGPFRDIQVGGDDGAFAFIAFGDHLVKVFILGSLQGLEAEVVDDQKIDARPVWQSAGQSRWWPGRR